MDSMNLSPAELVASTEPKSDLNVENDRRHGLQSSPGGGRLNICSVFPTSDSITNNRPRTTPPPKRATRSRTKPKALREAGSDRTVGLPNRHPWLGCVPKNAITVPIPRSTAGFRLIPSFLQHRANSNSENPAQPKRRVTKRQKAAEKPQRVRIGSRKSASKPRCSDIDVVRFPAMTPSRMAGSNPPPAAAAPCGEFESERSSRLPLFRSLNPGSKGGWTTSAGIGSNSGAGPAPFGRQATTARPRGQAAARPPREPVNYSANFQASIQNCPPRFI